MNIDKEIDKTRRRANHSIKWLEILHLMREFDFNNIPLENTILLAELNPPKLVFGWLKPVSDGYLPEVKAFAEYLKANLPPDKVPVMEVELEGFFHTYTETL